jgi:hypothetical protein
MDEWGGKGGCNISLMALNFKIIVMNDVKVGGGID